MKNARSFRALGLLCRQQAAYNPDQKWTLLAQAEHWEYLAEVATVPAHKKHGGTKSIGLKNAEASSKSVLTVSRLVAAT